LNEWIPQLYIFILPYPCILGHRGGLTKIFLSYWHVMYICFLCVTPLGKTAGCWLSTKVEKHRWVHSCCRIQARSVGYGNSVSKALSLIFL